MRWHKGQGHWRTIEELEREIEATLKPGADEMRCLCGRRVHLDKRWLSESMAWSLGRIWKYNQKHPVGCQCRPDCDGWMDYRNWRARGEPRQHSLLRHMPWGLVERSDRRTGKNAGWWRTTERGRDFVEGRIVVPKYVWYYNDAVYAWSDRDTSFRKACGKKFDLDELLHGLPEGKRP